MSQLHDTRAGSNERGWDEHIASLSSVLQQPQAADLLAHRREQLHLETGVRMGVAMLDVDDALNAAARNDGRRKECLKGILRQIAEKLEARIGVGFPRDGEQPAFARHPTS